MTLQAAKFKFIVPFFIMRLRCILKQIWQIILPDLKLFIDICRQTEDSLIFRAYRSIPGRAVTVRTKVPPSFFIRATWGALRRKIWVYIFTTPRSFSR